jgi:hypothetical protein
LILIRDKWDSALWFWRWPPTYTERKIMSYPRRVTIETWSRVVRNETWYFARLVPGHGAEPTGAALCEADAVADLFYQIADLEEKQEEEHDRRAL